MSQLLYRVNPVTNKKCPPGRWRVHDPGGGGGSEFQVTGMIEGFFWV